MPCCGTRPVPSLQVPWRALRSPVVVELSDVHLRVALRRDADLEEGPAGERSWAAKQAELAAAELAALAAASAGGGAGGADAAAGAGAGVKGGVLWGFMQHVLSMLVNRLQLTVRSVHIEFEVGLLRAASLLALMLLALMPPPPPPPGWESGRRALDAPGGCHPLSVRPPAHP